MGLYGFQFNAFGFDFLNCEMCFRYIILYLLYVVVEFVESDLRDNHKFDHSQKWVTSDELVIIWMPVFFYRTPRPPEISIEARKG